MATTARLPDALKQEAETYARGLGVSLNALLAFALRDYLDARRGLVVVPAPVPSVPVAAPAVVAFPPGALSPGLASLVALASPDVVRVHEAQPAPPDWSAQPAQGRRVPCPCGSHKPWKDCHGRKAKPLTISRAMA
jgi:hypothetical protein